MGLRIGIVGAGTAGLAAASFLARDGHEVVVLEQFQRAQPLGAGLLLQPTGLALLARLGLDRAAIAGGSPIRHLYGRSANSGRVVFDIGYRELGPAMFGLGIHRGALFALLHESAVAAGARIQTGTRIVALHRDGGLPVLTDAGGQAHGLFDLVVDAHGIRSGLRTDHADLVYDRPYPYGAVWTVLRDNERRFADDTLTQRYRHAHNMAGILPLGHPNGEADPLVAFFWSLPVARYAAWQLAGIEAWRTEVRALWPEAAELLPEDLDPATLSFATYADIRLKRPYADRLAFIGDAAHCTSPQLGQGANLALADAFMLAQSLVGQGDVNAALRDYAGKRHGPVRFYQAASRQLTPFFQSGSRAHAWARDVGFGPMARVPYLRREMLRTLSGVKTGLFTSLDPGKWSQEYSLRRTRDDR